MRLIAHCHGQRALGSVPGDSIVGRAATSLSGKQLADFSEEERASWEMHSVVNKPELADEQAWADPSAFLNPLPRASFLGRYLNSLDTEEPTAVADYLSRMRGPIQDHDRMNSDSTAKN